MRQLVAMALLACLGFMMAGGLEERGTAVFSIQGDVLLAGAFLYLVVENTHNKLMLLLVLTNNHPAQAFSPTQTALPLLLTSTHHHQAQGCFSALVKLIRGTATIADDVVGVGAAAARHGDDVALLVAGSTVRGTGMEAVKKLSKKILTKIFDPKAQAKGARELPEIQDMMQLAERIRKMSDDAPVDDYVKKIVGEAAERVAKEGGEIASPEVIKKLLNHFNRKELVANVDELLELTLENVKFVDPSDLVSLSKYTDEALEALLTVSQKTLTMEAPGLSIYVRQAAGEIISQGSKKLAKCSDELAEVMAFNAEKIKRSGSAFPKHIDDISQEARELFHRLKSGIDDPQSSVEELVSHYTKAQNVMKYMQKVMQDPRLNLEVLKVTDEVIGATAKATKKALKEATTAHRGNILARQLNKFKDLSAKKKFLAIVGVGTGGFGLYGTGKTIYDSVRPSSSDKREDQDSSSSKREPDSSDDGPELDLEESRYVDKKKEHKKVKKEEKSKKVKVKKQKNSTKSRDEDFSQYPTNINVEGEDYEYEYGVAGEEEKRRRRSTTSGDGEDVEVNGTHEIHLVDGKPWLVMAIPQEEVRNVNV